jgi:tetratricopeptide (TPR) repeat protein
VALALGDPRTAQPLAKRSVAMWERLGDQQELALALARLGRSELFLGDRRAARAAMESSVALAQTMGDKEVLADGLSKLAQLEAVEHDFERCLELLGDAVTINLELGNAEGLLVARHSMGCALRDMGLLEQAHHQMWSQIPDLLRLARRDFLLVAGACQIPCVRA